MRHLHIVVLAVVVSLLVVAVACNSGDDAPAATDTPAADAATATIVIDPTALPDATATPLPQAAGPCPINDTEFCDLARALDAALKSGDMEMIVASTRRGGQSLAGREDRRSWLRAGHGLLRRHRPGL